jgi:putative membrane protein insertion efficiency factor
VTGILRSFAIGMVRFYQRYISPYLPSSCRYVPSCSVYTEHAIRKYGVVKGVFMGTLRILRCNPLFKGGYDPVDLFEYHEK